VKSSNTGTYICEFLDQDNSRQISKSYTINTVNTWEKKTITVPPDTTGLFDNDNAISLILIFYLAAGTDRTSGTLNSSAWATTTSANRAVNQLNLANASGNYWAVTGIQLETGTVATPFEMRNIGQELQLCRRYFRKLGNGSSSPISGQGAQYLDANAIYFSYSADLTDMRTAPTLSLTGSANTDYAVYNSQFSVQTGFTFALGAWSGSLGAQIQCSKTSHGLTNTPQLYFGSVTTSGSLLLSSEL
jgi:hypothetical protein